MRSKSLSALAVSSALAVGLLSASAVSAQQRLFPGMWSLGGVQTICLERGGAWHGVSFSPWSGEWFPLNGGDEGGLVGIVFGNFNGGADNDSMAVGIHLRTNWTEWSDDLTSSQFLQVSLSYVSHSCPPPVAAPHAAHRHPMD
jgi:hypothetical protein